MNCIDCAYRGCTYDDPDIGFFCHYNNNKEWIMLEDVHDHDNCEHFVIAEEE